MPRGRGRIIASVGVAGLFVSACSSSSRAVSANSTDSVPGSIGELAPPSPPLPGPLQDTTPLSQEMTCGSYAAVQTYAGVRLLHLVHPPVVASEVITCTAPGRPPGSPPPSIPTSPASHEQEVFVCYVPPSIAETATSDDVRARGLEIIITPEELPRPAVMPNQPNLTAPTARGDTGSGGYAPVTINGNPGEVQRIATDAVRVAWERVGTDGHRVLVGIVGNFSPDAMVAYARDLVEGNP